MSEIFVEDEFFKKLDFILFNGDIFDLLLDTASDENIAIRAWFASFLRRCAKYEIVVRVVRGTSYHDWEQPVMLVEENQNHDIGCDLRYITKIEIERNEKLGLTFLYIPDEARPTTDETWEYVQGLLKEYGLEKVDITTIHGGMEYQLPDLPETKAILHRSENYEKITRLWVNTGHIHQPSKHGIILTNGSTDRLKHGEEHDKGHWRLIKGQPKFIVNKRAMRYKTLNVIGMAADSVIATVADYLHEDTSPCSVLLSCNKGDAATSLYRRLSDMFPFCRFEFKTHSQKKNASIIESTRRHTKLPKLTKENLAAEWLKCLAEEHPDKQEEHRQYIEGFIYGNTK